jgi:hypothetical protein
MSKNTTRPDISDKVELLNGRRRFDQMTSDEQTLYLMLMKQDSFKDWAVRFKQYGDATVVASMARTPRTSNPITQAYDSGKIAAAVAEWNKRCKT